MSDMNLEMSDMSDRTWEMSDIVLLCSLYGNSTVIKKYIFEQQK